MKPTDFGANFYLYDDLFLKFSTLFGIPMPIPKAICMVESALGLDVRVARGLLNPSDVGNSASRDGVSWGLMQMKPSTCLVYDSFATPEKLNHADYSIKLGCQHLARLSNRLDQDEYNIVRAWNQGLRATRLQIAGEIPGRAEEYLTRYLTCKSIL